MDAGTCRGRDAWTLCQMTNGASAVAGAVAGHDQPGGRRCLGMVEDFCPGFRRSVIGRDVLTPLALERVFGLHRHAPPRTHRAMIRAMIALERLFGLHRHAPPRMIRAMP